MFCTSTVDWLYKLEKDYVWKSPCTHEKIWGTSLVRDALCQFIPVMFDG